MKKLSRIEMKNLMGGLREADPGCTGSCPYNWTDYQGKKHTTSGTCSKNAQSGNLCYCSNGVGSCTA